MSLWHREMLWIVEPKICCYDLIGRTVFLASNLSLRWCDGQLRLNGEGGGGQHKERSRAIVETAGKSLSCAPSYNRDPDFS
jgi:hypothetical protein